MNATSTEFAQIDEIHRERGADAAIDRVVELLRSEQKYHQLFDALLLKKKHALGAPLTHPTSFDDVPDAQRSEFEQAYINAAREVGESFLQQGKIGQAWLYLRTIREPAKVVAAIERIQPGMPFDDEIIDIALYQGVAPAKGLELLLSSHGTCSSITALDQQFTQFPGDVRQKCAAILVRKLYDDLVETLRHEVERKQGLTPPGQTLRELISGRDWLFNEDNYHIDVSHLHAVVRFSRALEAGSPELPLAIQLAEYGSHLSSQYQYAGDPPFDDFYPAHVQYLKAISGEGRDAALAYFREKIGADVHDTDNQLAALAYVDLMTRLERFDEALDVAEKYLLNAQDQFGFSFAEL
ncbi:MAG TPA: hypothetical protein VHB77_01715, partial [Planctomycetaceae bacterium]|nr:hypothetical protein [Planctomycetaceae bacterium]